MKRTRNIVTFALEQSDSYQLGRDYVTTISNDQDWLYTDVRILGFKVVIEDKII